MIFGKLELRTVSEKRSLPLSKEVPFASIQPKLPILRSVRLRVFSFIIHDDNIKVAEKNDLGIIGMCDVLIFRFFILLRGAFLVILVYLLEVSSF